MEVRFKASSGDQGEKGAAHVRTKGRTGEEGRSGGASDLLLCLSCTIHTHTGGCGSNSGDPIGGVQRKGRMDGV